MEGKYNETKPLLTEVIKNLSKDLSDNGGHIKTLCCGSCAIKKKVFVGSNINITDKGFK
jgi:hypothetical protein